jgi:hypothetical protein
MNHWHWTMTRLCLAGGLALGAVVSQADAQTAAVGVARISKGRTAPAAGSDVQQTGFVDWIDDASDAAEAISESVANATARVENGILTRTAALGRHRKDANETAAPSSSESEDCPIHDENCKCKACKAQRKLEKKLAKDEQRRWDPFCKTGCPHCFGYHGYYSHNMLCYFHSKFGCLCPSGNGGAGAPLCGCYSRVYPQDVGYFDQRDGQLYAAQGYGVPIAVPLAPVVGHAYNYGWGVPSSRLTPISHVAPR